MSGDMAMRAGSIHYKRDYRRVRHMLDGLPLPPGNKAYLIPAVSIYEFAGEFIGKQSRGVLLDIGCWLGYGTDYLARRLPGWKIVGVDIMEKAVSFAKKRFSRDNLSFLCMDMTEEKSIEELLFTIGKADIICCFEVFEHVPHDYSLSLLGGMKQLINPEGRILVSTPNRPIYDINTYEKKHVNEIVPLEMMHTMEETSFKLTNIYGFDRMNPPMFTVLDKLNLVARRGKERCSTSPPRTAIRLGLQTLLDPRYSKRLVTRKLNPERCMKDWYHRMEPRAIPLPKTSDSEMDHSMVHLFIARPT